MSTISLSLRLWHRARDVCASAMPMPHPLTAVATFHLAAARENHITAAAELRALASALGEVICTHFQASAGVFACVDCLMVTIFCSLLT